MTHNPKPPTVDANTAKLGYCAYCGDVLYDAGPTSPLDEPLSHVACAVDARRRGTRV